MSFSRSISPLTHQSGSWVAPSPRIGLPAPGRSSKSPRSIALRTCRSTHSPCCSIRCAAASSLSGSSASAASSGSGSSSGCGPIARVTAAARSRRSSSISLLMSPIAACTSWLADYQGMQAFCPFPWVVSHGELPKSCIPW